MRAIGHQTSLGRSDARNYLVLAVGTAVLLGFGLHAVSPVLPVVQQVFGINDFEVGLVTSAYVLPGALLGFPLGVAADVFGRRRVFAASAVLYGVMGVAQGLAPTFTWLLIWRTGQGLAFGALMPLTVTVIGDAFRGLQQVRAQATRQIAMAMATLVVPVLSAQLAEISWTLPFMSQGLIALPGLRALFVLDDRRFGTGATSGYLRKAVEAVRRPGFPSVLIAGFIRFMARFSILGFLPLHLTRGFGASLTQVGVIMGIATGLGFASAALAARLSRRVRPSTISSVALTIGGIALMGFSFLSGFLWSLVVAVVFAMADGLVSVLQSSYAARGTPDEVRGGVVAVNGMSRNGGKFVGPLITGSLAAWTGIATALAITGVVVALCGVAIRRGLLLFDPILMEDAETPSRQGGEA